MVDFQVGDVHMTDLQVIDLQVGIRSEVIDRWVVFTLGKSQSKS